MNNSHKKRLALGSSVLFLLSVSMISGNYSLVLHNLHDLAVNILPLIAINLYAIASFVRNSLKIYLSYAPNDKILQVILYYVLPVIFNIIVANILLQAYYFFSIRLAAKRSDTNGN